MGLFVLLLPWAWRCLWTSFLIWTWLFSSSVELGNLSLRMAGLTLGELRSLFWALIPRSWGEGVCCSNSISLSCWLPDVNSAVTITGGAQTLMSLRMALVHFREPLVLNFEPHFLAPVQNPQLTGTDHSSHWHRLSSFHTDLRAFQEQTHKTNLHEILLCTLDIQPQSWRTLPWNPDTQLDSLSP